MWWSFYFFRAFNESSENDPFGPFDFSYFGARILGSGFDSGGMDSGFFPEAPSHDEFIGVCCIGWVSFFLDILYSPG